MYVPLRNATWVHMSNSIIIGTQYLKPGNEDYLIYVSYICTYYITSYICTHYYVCNSLFLAYIIIYTKYIHTYLVHIYLYNMYRYTEIIIEYHHNMPVIVCD